MLYIHPTIGESCCKHETGGLGGGGERSLLLYELYIFFLFLLAHEPAALEEHIMELKHLNDCES